MVNIMDLPTTGAILTCQECKQSYRVRSKTYLIKCPECGGVCIFKKLWSKAEKLCREVDAATDIFEVDEIVSRHCALLLKEAKKTKD